MNIISSGRPTEISENDVFLCESLYDETNRVARKLKSGLRKFEHTKDVTVDEVARRRALILTANI